MNRWIRNKVVIGYIVIFVLLTLPLFVKVLQHYDTLGKIETALHKLYRDTCHEDVEEIVVRANILQPFSIIGGVDSLWGATTSSKLIPSVSGYYGKKVISINKFPCSNYEYILDKGKKEFVPIEYLILGSTDDNEGIPLLGYYFLILAYFVYFSSILIILLVFGIKKLIGVLRNSRESK
ncbi:hypothetical protein [Paenibacillus alvei]|uniref:hypothetical protein n=1 Tax=Paenibacillus alvei TaxID=44250 RepID=UPI000385E0ED|nr:hypothetical protein [Paenibacillus alvei]EPY12186.1 hypothetical protein PAAL66ix_14286 [Paenibacillus alvei A6-6i-x]